MMPHPSFRLLPCLISLCLILLLHCPSPAVATCEQCALIGNCTAALPDDQPGTFCSITTTATNLTAYLCCPLTYSCLPSPTPQSHTNHSCQPPSSQLSSSSSSSSGSSSASSTSDSSTLLSGSADSYMSWAFIGVSLLFAAFVGVLLVCVCCNVVLACGQQWKRDRRRDRARRAVMHVENDEERKEREQREERERLELERRRELTEKAREKVARLQREREEMDAILQRAREQVEKRKRQQQQAAMEMTVDTTNDQCTMEGREGESNDAEDGAVRCVEEIELGHV